MKMIKLMSIAVAALMVVAVFAQDAGPNNGGGQRGGGRQQGGGGGRGGMMGGMQQVNPMEGSGFQVLQRADVQTELGLNEEQKAAVVKLQSDMMASMREKLMAARESGADRATIMAEMDKAVGGEIKKILDDAQEVRFVELRIQIAGIRAVIDASIQSKLKLEQGQRSKIAGAKATYEKAIAGLQPTRGQGGQGQQQADQQAAREAQQKARQDAMKALTEELNKILTDENKADLKALGGKEFAGAKTPQGGNRQGGQGGGRQPGQGAAGGGATGGNGGGAGGDFGPEA